ncbi:MAG TPA: chemotaxis protein CheW [Ktedonobacterales bacterium]
MNTGQAGPKHVLFTVQGAPCALPADAVLGVERITSVALVPNTVDWVLGVVQAQGNIVSAVDFSSFLGMPPTQPTPQSRLIVTSRGPITVGLVVDTVEMRALDGTPSLGQGIMPEWARPFAGGMFDLGGKQTILFDPDKLLFSDRMKHYRA